jgi:flagellar biosynthesis GTPase FlhF
MTYIKKHKRGIIGTAIFHMIILLLLIFLGFFTPLPLPGEEGILVNFGTSEQGLGDIEPAPQRREPEPPPPTQSEPEPATTPPPQPATTPPAAQPEPAEEVAMTQDYEETAAIDAAEKKRQEEAERRRQLEEQRRRQEQLEQQRIAEAERQRQAEIERQRQAELAERERQKREEEQRRIAEINSRAQGAFGGNTSGTGGQGTGTNKSQGATFPGGNQGSPTGDPNAGTYGPGGSGSGDQGAGISYSLSGRSARSLPKPVYPGDDEGLVVVKVTVDKNGNVTAAEPGARGTTIMNQRFWAEARQAALKAKFNTDESAPAFQQGTISYRFRLD